VGLNLGISNLFYLNTTCCTRETYYACCLSFCHCVVSLVILYFCPEDNQKHSGWHAWGVSAFQDHHHGNKSVLLLGWSNLLLKVALSSW